MEETKMDICSHRDTFAFCFFRDAKIARGGIERGVDPDHCYIAPHASNLVLQDNPEERIVDVNLAVVLDQPCFISQRASL
jgi:hypothetical protein